MNVYSFAGCIMSGASFLSPFLPGAENSTRGMSTEGVLRLLAGETLAIDPEQLAQLKAKTPSIPDNYGTFNGLDAENIDGILWTPVSDAIFLTPRAQCPDRTVYPFYDGFLDETLGTTGASLSLEAISSLWTRLYEQTKEIADRGLVFYPTDHLKSGPWKQRIDVIQDKAARCFHGWHQFTIEAELADPNGYWAHYSERAMHALRDEVERWLS